MRATTYSFLLAIGLAPAWSLANCFAEMTGGDEPYTRQLETQPKAAIEPILRELASRAKEPRRPPAPLPSTAHLYAMLMDAYDDSGDIDKAAEASRQGLAAWGPDDGDGLRRRLELTGLLIVDEQGQIAKAHQGIETATAKVPADAPDLICVLLDRGHLRQRAGDKVNATTDTLRAYQLAREIGREGLRIEAGLRLAAIYGEYHLYDEARSLQEQAVRYYESQNNRDGLGITRLKQGVDLLQEGRYGEAETRLLQARSLYRANATPGDEAVAQVYLCATAVKLPERKAARDYCREAYDAAQATQYPEGAKMATGSLGELELAEGNAAEAVRQLDRALANDGVDLTGRVRAEFLNFRGQARAKQNDLRGAMQDIETYVGWLKADHETAEADTVALLRARFESALSQEALQKARAEALASQSMAAREALVRNVVAASSISVLIVVLVFGQLWRRREQLLRSRQAASDRLMGLGRLAGGIAHEFNNQLTVMRQAIGLLARRDSVAGDPEALELVGVLDESACSSAHITAQLQSFGRQQNLQPRTVELEAYLKGLQPLLQQAAGVAVKVDITVDPPELSMWSDDRLFGGALLNLVVNARDAMPGGGTVSIRAAADGARVRIEVSDTGCGMNPEVLGHAVDPFFSTKQVGSGAGLGLSMVDGFVMQSGGALQICSELGHGTTVSMWMPAKAAAW